MANKTFQSRIVQKHDTQANWEKATNFIPLKGEIIVYDDLNKIKIGDGSTKINDLAFIIPAKLSDLEDDKTFIVTLSGTSSSNYTIDSTSSEIYQQFIAGKQVYLKKLNSALGLIPLVGHQGERVSFFATPVPSSQQISIVIQGSAVSYNTYTLQTTSNKTTTISSASTDTQYPSAKAVYTTLQDYLPLTGGDIAGSLTITNTGDQLQLNDIRFSSSTQVTQCELYLKDPRGRTIRLNGISYPQDDNDATNRQYVDDEIAKKSSVTIITWSDDGT